MSPRVKSYPFSLFTNTAFSTQGCLYKMLCLHSPGLVLDSREVHRQAHSSNILTQSPQALFSKETVCLHSIKISIQYIKPKNIYRDHSISSPQNKKFVGKERNRACKVLRYVASPHFEHGNKRLWIFLELLNTDIPIKAVSISHQFIISNSISIFSIV